MTPMEQSERKGLVERLRRYADIFSAVPANADPIVTEWGALTVDALRKAADLLSSDARPAPMAEEVKAALMFLAEADVAVDEYTSEQARGVLSAHIATLTRKVAEYQARLEIDHAWTFKDGQKVRHEIPPEERDSFPDGIECRDETIKLQDERIARLLSRPSPGPATETDRKDGEAMNAASFWIVEPKPESYTAISVGFTPAFWSGREYPHSYVRDVNFALQFCRKVDADVYIAKHLETRNDPSSIPQYYAVEHMWMPPLLASVRPKEEGV